jgi:dTDP-4-dehydrorhamnose 3,5-epimerase
MSLHVTETEIPGVRVLHSAVFQDARGYFLETFNQRDFHDAGIDVSWKQDNLSLSAHNVLRGLHYQLHDPQIKLVRVVRGAVFDVAVDLRRSSPTFGRHTSIELREGDGQALLIPVGFAHGFLALEPDTIFQYKVSEFYNPIGDCTILWNDPALGIPWPIAASDAIVSPKDLQGKPLALAPTFA